MDKAALRRQAGASARVCTRACVCCAPGGCSRIGHIVLVMTRTWRCASVLVQQGHGTNGLYCGEVRGATSKAKAWPCGRPFVGVRTQASGKPGPTWPRVMAMARRLLQTTIFFVCNLTKNGYMCIDMANWQWEAHSSWLETRNNSTFITITDLLGLLLRGCSRMMQQILSELKAAR